MEHGGRGVRFEVHFAKERHEQGRLATARRTND